jgi:hypothetical protein
MKAKATQAVKSMKTKDDADELALLASFEAGEWAAVSDEAADIARYRAAAAAAAAKALLKNKL